MKYKDYADLRRAGFSQDLAELVAECFPEMKDEMIDMLEFMVEHIAEREDKEPEVIKSGFGKIKEFDRFWEIGEALEEGDTP